MDYLLFGRIAKGVALIGFLLPWVTVSCSSTVLVEVTGLELMTGDWNSRSAELNEEAEPAPLVIAAFAAVLIGFAAALALRGRQAAIALLAGAILGMGLSYGSVANMRAELYSEMDDAREDAGADLGGLFSARDREDIGRSARAAIRVEEEEGFWLTMAALLAAAILGGVALAPRQSG